MRSEDPSIAPSSDAASDLKSPRLRKNALARFISDAAVVITGLVSAIVTARWLGPAGKGTLSTMLYIVTVSSFFASLGVGDAVIVLAAGHKKRLQKLISVSLPPVALASVPAIGIILIAAWMGNWSGIASAVVIACLLVPVRMLNYTLINFQNASEKLVRSSLISLIQVFIEVLFLVLLVAVAGMEILGAMVAALVGAATAIALSARSLAHDGLTLVPRWAVGEAWHVLSLGALLIAARIIIALAQRFDLLLVYAIQGEAPAGLYAIALTMGQLAAYTSGSLAIAAFPRLARIEDQHAWELIPRLARIGLTSALLSGLLIAAIVPAIVPIALGARFQGSVVPTLILIIGAIAWSELSILTRSVAALGHQVLQLASFFLYLIVMTALDLVLIPRWGINGAAIGSVIAPGLALVFFFAWYAQQPRSERLVAFIPHRDDLLELLVFLKETSRRATRLLLDPRRAWSG